MDIARLRLGVLSVVATLTLASVTSFAETPAGSKPPAKAGPPERPAAVQPKGLSNPALHLTDAQKARIDKILETYLAEQKALNQKYPAAKDSRQNAEALADARQARARMTEAVDQVLDASQRKILNDAQAELHVVKHADIPAGAFGGKPPLPKPTN